MQKDSIEALHQNRNPSVQEAGLSSPTWAITIKNSTKRRD